MQNVFKFVHLFGNVCHSVKENSNLIPLTFFLSIYEHLSMGVRLSHLNYERFVIQCHTYICTPFLPIFILLN